MAEAIILAKLNIISKQILSSDELNEIYKTFQNQNVKIYSDEQIYELLGLQAYYNNTDIIFNVLIPILSNKTYSFFHLIPLPINKTLSIITQPYIAYNEFDVQYFEESCPLIENIHYCKRPLKTIKINEPECIPNIIKDIPAKCKFYDGEEVSTIFQPEPDYILCINVPETSLKSTCSAPQNNIKGTALIHFKNCSIEINGITYESRSNIYLEEITIYPTMFRKINSSQIIENLSLQKLKSYNFKNQAAIELLKVHTSQRDYFMTGLTITFGIVITIFLVKRYKNRKHFMNIEEPNNITTVNLQETPRIQLLWPSLHQRGEELRMQSTPNIISSI